MATHTEIPGEEGQDSAAVCQKGPVGVIFSTQTLRVLIPRNRHLYIGGI